MRMRSKPVGGIVRAALYPLCVIDEIDLLPTGALVATRGEGLEVVLSDEGSSYNESVVSENGTLSIVHTLTLVAEREDAYEWMDEGVIDRLSREGCVADVTLGDGRRLLVGWSKRFGTEQPLRLHSLESMSAARCSDAPRVRLEMVSIDTDFSLNIKNIIIDGN